MVILVCPVANSYFEFQLSICSILNERYFFIIYSHSGNHITEQLREEYRIWDGGLMVAFGFLSVEEDFFLAKAQG